jgi:hypothetical protein
MEPRKQDLEQTQEPRPDEKPRRFRIVKLEERIAPSKGGNGTNNCPNRSGYCYTLNFCLNSVV